MSASPSLVVFASTPPLTSSAERRSADARHLVPDAQGTRRAVDEDGDVMDLHEHLVQEPGVAHAAPAAPQPPRESRPNVRHHCRMAS